ncbi:o-succinylbenzoate--CoA ligase [Paeniglutamicibacter cryotolerans]|uniref:O-succinylbenzoic acid--CoA ligase n=1 Tax=Paeniglutamicibacter cryotolerans TaxID=670079 RepID=A0A839QDD4_9MICC|nr:o-succinylbenzoate--CoA ligase [Paeniglutamicibacter cryotolerans]MBB2994188.1 O-succinylbenzoic acid--CoA ligase [Paeniglutamicibacter cryotolerans]
MNPDPALTALAAVLNGQGPAIEVLPGSTPEDYVVNQVDAAEFAGLPVDDDIAAVVRTSGSTGTPKRTALPVDALAASSMATAEALGFEGQWLLALPLHFVAGLSVLSRSLYAGTRPWAMEMSAPFGAAGFVEAAGALTDRIRITSLVPTQLQRLLTDPAPETLAALKRFDAILLGGGRAPAPVLAAARAHGLRIRLTYGMSETCGGCVYDGTPLPGTLARERDGRLWLGGPTLAAGYIGNPGLTTEHFSTDANGLRWFATDDHGTVHNGRVEVHGRADDVINTGGVKVSAGAVQRLLESVPGVTAALVVGVPDAQWGQRVAAAIVGDIDQAVVDGLVRAQLGRAAVPRRVLQLEALPLLPNGKPDRLAITALLSAHAG